LATLLPDKFEAWATIKVLLLPSQRQWLEVNAKATPQKRGDTIASRGLDALSASGEESR
jgi:hypothetical protein